MSLSELVEETQREVIAGRQQEQEILQEIAAITSVEFAEQAAEILDARKHAYSMEAYLELLSRLQQLINAGIPNCYVLDMVQTCKTVDTLLEEWRFYKSE